MLKTSRLFNAIKSFSKKRIMIIGDIVADEYIYGLTSRVSREAPVLILKFDSHTTSLGGAGNAMNNVQALGASVIPVSVVGNDMNGGRLINILRSKGVNTKTIVVAKGKSTTTKTRY